MKTANGDSTAGLRVGRLSLILAVGIMVSMVLFPVPAARGAGVIQTQKADCSNAVTCSLAAFGTNPVANDMIVVTVSVNTVPSTCSAAGYSPVVTDSLGTSFSLAGSLQTQSAMFSGTYCGMVGIYYGIAPSTGADTVTVTTLGISTSTSATSVQALESSGVQTLAGVTFANIASGSFTTGVTISTGLPVGQNDLSVADIYQIGSATISVGTGYTSVFATGNSRGMEYSTTLTRGTTPSTTNYPYGIAGTTTQYIEVGAVFTASGSSGSPGGSLTTGSCPTKDTSTTTMVNSTVYYYEGVTVGTTTLTSVSTFLASISGATTQNLYLGLYVGTAGHAVSATYPLTLQSPSQAFAITSGTKNSLISWVPSGLSMAPLTPYAIAVLGNSKLVLNQSGLTGLYSVGSASLPSTITSLSSSSSNLYLCASLSYTTSTTTTITQTTTSYTGAAPSMFSGSTFAQGLLNIGTGFGLDNTTWGLFMTLVFEAVAFFLFFGLSKGQLLGHPFILLGIMFLVLAICTGLTFFPIQYFAALTLAGSGLGILKLMGKI